MDDYLFVTTCPWKAKSFLEMMSAGHPEYGCKISEEKTLTNFDYDAQVMNVIPPGQRCTSSNILRGKELIGTTSVFPWCGLLVDTTDLSILADLTRYGGTGRCFPPHGTGLMRELFYIDLRDSLTVDRGRNPGVNFAHKMLRYAPFTFSGIRH